MRIPDHALALFCLTLLTAGCRGTGGEEAPPPADYVETIRGTEISFPMVWIPEGGFWIGATEVTWDEYLLYCDFDEEGLAPPGADAVSKPSQPLDWTPYDHDWGTGRRPALGMSWNAARKYCTWLSLNTGHPYRLPTEEEWELACADAAELPRKEVGWFYENSHQMTREVGLKAPNRYGLHDVLGNLWEYCDNPFDPADPERAVLRGGSWEDSGSRVDASSRLRFNDDWVMADPNFPPGVWWIPDGPHLGFRVLRPGP